MLTSDPVAAFGYHHKALEAEGGLLHPRCTEFDEEIALRSEYTALQHEIADLFPHWTRRIEAAVRSSKDVGHIAALHTRHKETVEH